jgi:hypothetical protein
VDATALIRSPSSSRSHTLLFTLLFTLFGLVAIMSSSRPAHRSPVKNIAMMRDMRKEELKQRCLARVAANRHSAINSARQQRLTFDSTATSSSPMASQDTAAMQVAASDTVPNSELRALISEEWRRMQAEGGTADSMANASVLDTELLSGSDYIDVMTALQELLYNDLYQQGMVQPVNRPTSPMHVDRVTG